MRGTGQRGHGTDGVAPLQRSVRGLLEQSRDLFVRFDAGLSQMPGPPLRFVDEEIGERPVSTAPLHVGRQLDYRGADQGVPEKDPPGCQLDSDQPFLLSWREVI